MSHLSFIFQWMWFLPPVFTTVCLFLNSLFWLILFRVILLSMSFFKKDLWVPCLLHLFIFEDFWITLYTWKTASGLIRFFTSEFDGCLSIIFIRTIIHTIKFLLTNKMHFGESFLLSSLEFVSFAVLSTLETKISFGWIALDILYTFHCCFNCFNLFVFLWIPWKYLKPFL